MLAGEGEFSMSRVSPGPPHLPTGPLKSLPEPHTHPTQAGVGEGRLARAALGAGDSFEMGVGWETSLLLLSHPLSEDRGQAKAPYSLHCTDPSPFTISDVLSWEAYTDPMGGGRGAGSPASILQMSKPRLAQPVRG